jgi:ubiquinone/menaquinone biosynthesis C-methylase UbiE
MNKSHENQKELIDIYRKRAKGYDSSGISSFLKWRKEAVRLLDLRRGDRVVDLGCGTGLNFALLEEIIGPKGRIIGVDLTDAMLDQARQRIAENEWKNVELVQSDAIQYEFPNQINGIIATFALTFMPDGERVILNGCKALAPERKWVVLDMAWPEGWPVWLQHLLFFLPRYGITAEVIARRPWGVVRQTIEQNLGNVEYKSFWKGFFYLISGSQTH